MDRTSRMKAILLFVAALTFAAAPMATPGFGGYDPSNFPIQLDDPAILPAGYAFAIWAVIYAGLVVHAGFGLFARAEDVAWDGPRWPLFGSLALGASWLMVAMANPVMATLQIWVMTVLALVALFRAPRIPDRWLLLGPIALYAGWLTAASCVSLGVVLIGHGIMGEMAASLAMLALALVIAFTVQTRLARAPEYGVAVIWALAAIIVANAGEGLVVPVVCLAGIILMVGAARRAALA
ncbi:hypothetical protein [Ostreiculturibacter nitratireducens]|uniref:hypothetical protein n=1 Tax=Ostreiculturibacter nitratireducens TaxID=3075226 RepID=UPI0031B5C2B1